MKSTALVCGFVALLGSVALSAHHAFSSEFDGNKPIKLRGTLTRMDFTNPHAWIYLDVKGPDGKVENWKVETGSVNQLIRAGLRKTDFPIGIEVLVDGYLARDASRKANGSAVRFADGRDFYLGSSRDTPP